MVKSCRSDLSSETDTGYPLHAALDFRGLHFLIARERYIIGAFAAGETPFEGVSVELKRKYPIFVRSKSAGLGSALVYSHWRAVGTVVVDGDLSS